MANIPAAIEFIQQHASPAEALRLRYLLSGQAPSAAELQDFLSAQRPDGGWAPFWAPDYSGLDATCFRLAQTEQMGLEPAQQAFLERACGFLASRQHADGSWEEDLAVADHAPAWAKPDDLAARLYLTANCGLWLAKYPPFLPQARQAGEFLSEFIDEETGSLPSFAHTHWLAAGLLYRTGPLAAAERVGYALWQRRDTFSASELAWLLTSLYGLHTHTVDALTQHALERLLHSQAEDGRWPSDDGPMFDVHSTLEALFVLKRYG